MDKPYQVAPDIHVLPAHLPIPGMGFLPVNAFVIKAREPVLVDTGMAIDSREFMKALESVIDPQHLRWVWLTHDDADHIGSIQKVLEATPNARLAVTALAAIRMSTAWPVPMDRVYCLNPGEGISVGDRKLSAVRPPLFDNPTAIGIYDDKAEVYFSVDSFGAIIPLPTQDAADVPEGDLAQGMSLWASADSPWVHMVEPSKFGQVLDRIRRLGPKTILSAHLPPAQGKTAQLLELLAGVPTSEPFVAPNQAALEQILAQIRGSGQAG
jgi:glyoxylase-like metal-dependent hydrolase (beta-lactamase superfamily II)